jgi:hypothetical protein
MSKANGAFEEDVRRLGHVTALGVLITATLGSLCALAQEDVEYLRFEAAAFIEDGDYEGAAQSLRKAYEMGSDLEVVYDLAQLEARLRRPGAALDLYQEYLRKGEGKISSLREKEVRDLVEALKDACGAIDVFAPAGAVVLVDGVPRGQAPLSRPVSVSAAVEHEIGIDDGGSETVRVRPGEVESVRFSLQSMFGSGRDQTPEERGARDDDDARDKGRSGGSTPARAQKTAGIALTVIGGAALVASAVTGGLANSKAEDLATVCSGMECDMQYTGLLEKRDNLALSTDVLWISGAALAVTGLVLWVTDDRGEKKRKKRGAQFDFAAAGALTSDGAEISARWRF